MNRDKIVEISKSILIDNKVTIEDAFFILSNFIEEHNNSSNTKQIVEFIMTSIFKDTCLLIALEHFIRKFEIIKVIKNNKIISIY